MNVRTFWNIFLKILGILSVVKGIHFLFQIIQSLFSFSAKDTSFLFFIIGTLVFSIAFYSLIFFLCFVKTNWVIEKLHLNNGFEEDRIDLNLETSTIYSVVVIIIGGILFLNSLPAFFQNAISFFQQKDVLFRENPFLGHLIYNVIALVVSYLLITNSKPIASFIDKQSTK